MVPGLRLGSDLGGTKVELAAFDGAGAELLRRRIDTPAGNYAATVHAIASLVHQAEQALGTRGSVGVGTPGAASLRTGPIRTANSAGPTGRDWRADPGRALALPG